MKFYFFSLLFIFTLPFSLNGMEQDQSPITLGERPLIVQEYIDKTFDRKRNEWGYAGRHEYQVMDFDAKQIIRDIAAFSEKKDIYFLDVGAGNGSWGRYISGILEEEFFDRDVHFHVISVTGANELTDQTITSGNVTLYAIPSFKIENCDTEFQQRGFDLTNKIDFIISEWTLQHLVDPLGTLKKLYGLVSPQNGMLLSSGFCISLNGEYALIPKDVGRILSAGPAQALFRYKNGQEYCGDFLLVKTDERPFTIPIDYVGTVRAIGRADFSSGVVTECKSLSKETSTWRTPFHSTDPYKDNPFYFGDAAARKLFEEYKNRRWVSKPGFNDTRDSLARLNAAIKKHSPEYIKCQLNGAYDEFISCLRLILVFEHGAELSGSRIEDKYAFNVEVLDKCQQTALVTSEEYNGLISLNDRLHKDKLLTNMDKILSYRKLIETTAKRLEINTQP